MVSSTSLKTSDQTLFMTGRIAGGSHLKNLMWQLTASAAGQSKRWSTTCRGNPAIMATGTGLGSMQENPDVIPPQKCPFHWWAPHLSQFAGPTQMPISNGISIGSAIIAGLTVVTDRWTDRPRYFVCSNRPHLPSAAMQPNTLNSLPHLHGTFKQQHNLLLQVRFSTPTRT